MSVQCPSGSVLMSVEECTANGGSCSTYSYDGLCCCAFPSPPKTYTVYVTVNYTGNYSPGSVCYQIIAKNSNTGIYSCDSITNQQLQLLSQSDTLIAYIYSAPSGWNCSITPTQATATAGGSYTFTVSCPGAPAGPPSSGNQVFFNVYVPPEYSGQVGWVVSDQFGNVGQAAITRANQYFYIGSATSDTLKASIQFNPPGASCTIAPSETTVNAGQSADFTVTCSPSPTPTQATATATAVSPTLTTVTKPNWLPYILIAGGATALGLAVYLAVKPRKTKT